MFKQSNNKACGPDGLKAEIIKHSFDYTSNHFHNIYNTMFYNAEHPYDW